MKRSFVLLLLAGILSIPAFSQNGSVPKPAASERPVAAPAPTSPADLAKATLAVHGGDKLKKLKSLVMKGSVDVNVMGQPLAGAFSLAFSGDKYFFEIVSPVQQMKQVYDGRQTYSSVAPFSLPPITTVGFFVIARVGDTGYVAAALPEKAKKKNGFRITSPEGYYTDFFVDEKTGQIKGYESAFEVNGQVVTTSVDIDEYQTVEGLILPKKYAQRFDLGQVTAYANFKPKTILVNSVIEDSSFAIPK